MTPRRPSPRLGIVPYLNVLPLLEGLEQTFPRENWVRATPRELGGLLAAGEVDVAILPVFEALREGGHAMVPGCAIGCDGPVRSVQLFAAKPIAEVRRVLLDRSSLTSVNLARIILPEHLGLSPEYELSPEPIPEDFDLAASGFDAAVVIGDVALAWDGRFEHAVDLGAAWKEMTGLPFVFAGWFVRPGVRLRPGEIAAFVRARREGERAVYDIAKRVAGEDSSRVVELVSYLSRSVRYALGEAELAAIEEFRRRLVARGLLPEDTARLTLLPEPVNPANLVNPV